MKDDTIEKEVPASLVDDPDFIYITDHHDRVVKAFLLGVMVGSVFMGVLTEILI